MYYILLTFYIEHCTPNFLWPFFVPFCKLLYVWSGWENEISLSLCFLACTELYVLHTTWTTIFLEGKKAVVIPSYTSDWVTWREIWHNFGKWKIPLIFLFFFRTKIVLWHLFYELRPILIEWKSQNTNSFDKIKENKDAQNVYVVVFINSKKKVWTLNASLPQFNVWLSQFYDKGLSFLHMVSFIMCFFCLSLERLWHGTVSTPRKWQFTRKKKHSYKYTYIHIQFMYHELESDIIFFFLFFYLLHISPIANILIDL